MKIARGASKVVVMRQAKADETFRRADKQQELGNLKSGFRLLLAAAKIGNESAQLNLGYTYDVGLGVRRNRSAAMFWYKRAYRNGRGSPNAAANIGTIYRDERNEPQAIAWFRRASQHGDIEANLELAKLYLRKSNCQEKAFHCLQIVLDGTPPIGVGEDAQEEARLLQAALSKDVSRRNP
jgi:TPR repeat protein